jgi:putative colanic acid biosynthesis acetyltransferase WcaF
MRAFGADIGAGCIIRQRVRVNAPWKLSLGENTWIGEGVWIINPERVSIGSNVCISQDVVICTGGHDAASASFARTSETTVIEDGVWIALRATVLKGITVGSHSTIGACALVYKDVEPAALVTAS